MSIISRFANQTVTLQRRLTNESFQGNTYTTAEEIAAHYRPRFGLTRTVGGDEVQAESSVMTETEVALGDLIEGSEVRRVEPIIKKGVTIGYWAFL